MLWLLIGIVLGMAYGFLWAWMLIDAEDDPGPMPSDIRRRDEWRSSGR